ncbi:MAG: hypothetical protein ABSG93_16385 [Solirubrobacteraceae bacterium]|jgi:hypothetical protein
MRRPLAMLCLPLSLLALAGCGSTASTAGFKGEQHEVAQTIANLQNDATAAEQKKICANDLAAALVTRLGGAKGCETAIKNQLAEVDNLETSVKSVDVAAGGKAATAQVKSIREGKTATSAVSLVKEGGKWKISGVG